MMHTLFPMPGFDRTASQLDQIALHIARVRPGCDLKAISCKVALGAAAQHLPRALARWVLCPGGPQRKIHVMALQN
ncbi:MAG: hypothetical protein A2Y38_24245 [Spirochaetes bacterium GWB1_59_5]|nr:MAG: hypothetical protein A2Y38_24245 [Spirochaetes bacterium GWB1_59_5]